MNEYKTGFKVVRILEDGSRVSAYLGNYKEFSKWSLKYPVGEFVTAPKNSIGIMCFNNFNDANKWKNHNSMHKETDIHIELKIIKIAYNCPEYIPTYIFHPGHENNFIKYLSVEMDHKKIIEEKLMENNLDHPGSLTSVLRHSPNGTICLSSIYCVE